MRTQANHRLTSELVKMEFLEALWSVMSFEQSHYCLWYQNSFLKMSITFWNIALNSWSSQTSPLSVSAIYSDVEIQYYHCQFVVDNETNWRNGLLSIFWLSSHLHVLGITYYYLSYLGVLSSILLYVVSHSKYQNLAIVSKRC